MGAGGRLIMTTEFPSQAGTSTSREIRIENKMTELAQVAALVDSFAAEHGLSNEVMVALNVSLDEILNNIISYAYEDAEYHGISVRLELLRQKVEVTVEDDGKPFNPLAVGTSDPGADPGAKSGAKPRAEGGAGLKFVRNLTDELTYVRRDGINQLRLAKRLS
jgi:serine/threonine-protein kinase RsbW